MSAASKLCAALVAAVVGATFAAGSAWAQTEPRFDVLVLSRTVPAASPHEESIAAGHAAIAQMGTQNNFAVTSTEDPTVFTDAGLRPYEAVVFLNTDGNGVLNPAQRNAFERWFQRGNGMVGIHSAANTDRDWDWHTDMMGGALFDNHPSGALQFQTATLNVEDTAHPATANVPQPTWVREDEWYNFTAEPRGKVHVLLTLDESTYEEQDGTPEADDHPIAWCSNYDRGRHLYTGLGHHGAYWSEPAYQAHIRGAIEWAAGAAEGNCGPQREGLPTDASFDKVTLDDNTENPMELAVAPDGRVFYIELAGRVKLYDPGDNSVRPVGNIPVHRGNENGLLGITLDPDFATNRWLYLFYSAPPQQGPTGFQHVSRFTVAENGTLDMASERVLLRIPHQRLICCHSAGSMTFGPGGQLYISTGDDTTPFETDSYAPLDDDVQRENVPGDPTNDANRAYDARRSSGNTNDLRGKILRIVPRDDPTGEPGPGNTYDIPAGNLFGLGGRFPGVPGQTRPEIYTMGHRNPFRIQVDQETGWLYNGEVGPDANNDSAERGPRGYDEINQIRQAGNMGWPFCIANNSQTPDPDDSYAYRDWTYPNGPAGAAFDCSGDAGGGPVNTSNYNTGLTQLPPASPALLWWPYGASPEFPDIPGGNGRTAVAGPTYHFDAANQSQTKLPAYYDDKVFFADWSRNWIATLTLDAAGAPADIEQFMPNTLFRHPHDIEMGPDGSLYVIEWGLDFNFAGQGINPDSGLYRIDFVKGVRSPVARASANRDNGPAPLEVQFSSEGTEDPDGDELTYSWNFGDGSTSSEPNPTHVFNEPGQYNVRLTVTDATQRTGTSTLVITAGNTRPTVELEIPEQGGVYGWGDAIGYRVRVTDPEDGAIDCDEVELVPGIFHDEGGTGHVHEGVRQTGCEGVIEAPADSGHAKSAVIALVVTAVYQDHGGSGGAAPPLIGADTHFLNPNEVQAEHFTEQSGVTVVDAVGAEGGRRTSSSNAGDWIYFEPFSLKGIDQLGIRYTAGGAGGLVEVRFDAPDGPLVGTADLVSTGGANNHGEITIPIDAPDDGTHRLYLVYAPRPGGPTTNMFQLDELTFIGRGVATDAAPSAAIEVDRTTGAIPLTVNFTGVGSDPEGTAVTYEWDFQSDGTVDATGQQVSHTYETTGARTVTLTVEDAGGRSRKATIRIEAFPSLAGCPGDDDFLGDALNRDLWSVVREVPADLTVGGGNLTIQSRAGDIFAGSEDGAQGPMQNIVLQDLPDSGAWTATTRLTWNPTGNFQNAGFKIYDSPTGDPTRGDGNWIKFGMVWNAGRKFELYKELNDGPQNLFTTATLPADFPSTFQMRLISDGTSIVAQYSADGQQWTNMGSAETNLSGFEDPKIGMYATATGQPSIPASFDWFTLDTPADGSDEFDGDELNLCRWTEIVRHDPEGYEVTGGELVMPAAHGDFFGDAPNDNPNVILQPAPAGEWTATTRLRFTPDENFEQAGIVVYGDDANYAKADLVSANGNRVLEFLRESDNAPTGFGGSVTLPADFPDTVEIRVVSDGTQLNAFYRAVDGDWAPFGDVDMTPIAAIPSPKIGIYANDGNQTVQSREQAAFDFFRLTAGVPDEEPPTTVHELEPAEPDGENGWYVSPVRVTLSTEEDATTEYKVGDGQFQAYDGPFTLDADGAQAVTYRSTDAAGNTEADRTFTVRIDRTAPTVACSAAPGELWPPDGRFVPVAVGLDVDDGASGAGSFRLESVTSSEAATDFARGWRVGFADTLGELRAIRNEKPTVGRTYSLAYTVFDRAGNGTPCTASVRVPRTRATSGEDGVSALVPSAESSAGGRLASWFTFGQTRLEGRSLRVVLRLPGEGALRIRGVVRARGEKSVRLRVRRIADAAGRTRLRLRVPAAAWAAVDRAGRAKVTIRVAYRPQGARKWRERKLTVMLVS
jgi:cytochrome c